MEYLSNHLLDQTQILKLNLDDQTIFYQSLKCQQPQLEDDPPMEDDLHWKTTSNGRRHPIEDNLK